MNIKQLSRVTLLLALAVIISGCTINLGRSNTSSSAKQPGGVWKSIDSGKKWEPIIAVPTTSGKQANIGNVSIKRITFDPQDTKVIYGATIENGIVYTINGGESWQQLTELSKASPRLVAVDAKNSCTLYTLIENKILQSVNCGRNWSVIYQHQTAKVSLTALTIDYATTTTMYLGDSEGEVIKSVNGGSSWQTVHRVKGADVAEIIVDPSDHKTIYVATAKSGIERSRDGGLTWANLGLGLKSYIGSHEYRRLIIDPATPGGLLLVSRYGMLRSQNYGDSWQALTLLPAPKATSITAVAINPDNSQEIHYATPLAMVSTFDGGQTWSSVKLPTARLISDLLIDPVQPAIMYLSTINPEK